ncbi:hypothetical protein CYMTET_42781 [Cymbomonas tetramitiformis]|uniref:FAD-binding FR-type domain-containing protein n=1 Tax=Cymbomonas tetramitiformis TaxID=36881 RepID=A0AAE0C4V2_9CHLO|nr:hypothetical protein CYMTET_42781 [Cymbomonas tetramitiformis]
MGDILANDDVAVDAGTLDSFGSELLRGISDGVDEGVRVSLRANARQVPVKRPPLAPTPASLATTPNNPLGTNRTFSDGISAEIESSETVTNTVLEGLKRNLRTAKNKGDISISQKSVKERIRQGNPVVRLKQLFVTKILHQETRIAGSTWISTLVTRVYSERKTAFFLLVHFIGTMVVWQHFFYRKFRVQEEKVPDVAPNYWWKRMVPPMEFGAMHAILFQMALLPLTMSRHAVSVLSDTLLGHFIPFERVVALHIHLGYTMCTIVFGSTGVFFLFFGFMCDEQKNGREPTPNGVMTFCEKFTEEIMLTGLGILGILLWVAFTSYFRNRIPYEVFYYGHHIVFFMFALAIAHTMDDAFRNGLIRSQNFKWFSGSLGIYIADRLFMAFRKESCSVAEWRALGGGPSNANKVVLLRLHKPIGFMFKPGHYVFLSVPEIDYTWHPFSIGSAPMQSTLDFYIEVYGPSSWSHQLWSRAAADPKLGSNPKVDVMGPYGTAISDFDKHRHVVAVGSGTGVVRMLSLLKSVYLQLYQVNAGVHLENAAYLRELTKQLVGSQVNEDMALPDLCLKYYRQLNSGISGANAQAGMSSRPGTPSDIPLRRIHTHTGVGVDDDVQHNHDRSTRPNSGDGGRPGTADPGEAKVSAHYFASLIQLHYRLWQLRRRGKDCATHGMLQSKQRRHLLLELLRVLALLPAAAELLVGALTVSWHGDLDGFPITESMESFLQVAMVLLILFFTTFVAFTPMSSFKWWADVLVVILSCIALGFWSDADAFGRFNTYQLFSHTGLSGYRMLRILWYAMLPGNERIKDLVSATAVRQASPVDSFQFIFITRSSDLAKYIWQDLDQSWSQLEQHWGKEYARKICRIKVFVTDTDTVACDSLRRAAQGSSLQKAGGLAFRRPDMKRMLSGEMLRRFQHDFTVRMDRSSASSTLVAFCGGMPLGNRIQMDVVDIMAASKVMSGSGMHEMLFTQENYGIAAPTKKRKPSGTPTRI